MERGIWTSLSLFLINTSGFKVVMLFLSTQRGPLNTFVELDLGHVKITFSKFISIQQMFIELLF